MLSLKPTQIKKLKTEKGGESFFNFTNDNEFPIRRYIENNYGYCAGYFYSEDEYTGDAFKFLLKNGKLLSYTSVGKISIAKADFYTGLRGGTFWFYYKNIYIRITMKNQPDDYEYMSHTSLNMSPKYIVDPEDESEVERAYENDNKLFSILFCAPISVQKFPIEEFEPFILNKTKGRVHIFIKNQYGEYDFEPIKLDIKDVDLEMNYGKNFLEIDEMIVTRLKEKSNGLYMFHGSPGTGKTTYIKHLTSKINKDFIYIPTNMLEYFTTDPNSLSMLLRKPNSILILEDAEKAILKREDGGSSSSVSSLLNLSDGIMSDIMKTSIIVTYNCSKYDIDDALKRKGRLQMDYEFGPLSIEDSHSLARSLNFPEDFIREEIKEPTSLADIYNLQTKVDFLNKKESSKRVIGFGS